MLKFSSTGGPNTLTEEEVLKAAKEELGEDPKQLEVKQTNIDQCVTPKSFVLIFSEISIKFSIFVPNKIVYSSIPEKLFM